MFIVDCICFSTSKTICKFFTFYTFCIRTWIRLILIFSMCSEFDLYTIIVAIIICYIEVFGILSRFLKHEVIVHTLWLMHWSQEKRVCAAPQGKRLGTYIYIYTHCKLRAACNSVSVIVYSITDFVPRSSSSCIEYI